MTAASLLCEASLMYNQIFFTNVLNLIDQRGLSKNEFAARASMSVSFLSDLTTGKANPSLRIMESIASALEVALPALLDTTDLDRETLDALSGGKTPSSLPPGLVRVTAVLTDYQAFLARQWDDANRQRLPARKGKKIADGMR